MEDRGFEIPHPETKNYIYSELGNELLSKRNFNVFLLIIFAVVTICMECSFVDNPDLMLVFFAIGLVSLVFTIITLVKVIYYITQHNCIKNGNYMVMPCVCTKLVSLHIENKEEYIGVKLAHAAYPTVEFDKVFEQKVPVFRKIKIYKGVNVWLVRTNTGKEFMVAR